MRAHPRQRKDVIGAALMLDMRIAAQSLSAGAVLVTDTLRHYEWIVAPLILEDGV